MIKLKNPIIKIGTAIDIPDFLAGYYLGITDAREMESVCSVYDQDKQFVDSGCIYSNESIEANTDEIIEEIPVEVETEVSE